MTLPALRAQRVIFVTDVFFRLELGEGGLVRGDILEQADLPKLEADDAFERIIEQIEEKWIYIDDPAVSRIENQDAILRGFE